MSSGSGSPRRDPAARADPAGLDTSLAEPFRFACRPDCGLCCFASPQLTTREAQALISIAPDFRPVGTRPARIPDRAEGGACHFLKDLRCTVHAARPSPCQEFPLSTHLSHRVQVSVVLSCPGIELDPLVQRTRSPFPPDRAISDSLSEELEAVRRALAGLSDQDRARTRASWHRALGVASSDGRGAVRLEERIRSELHRALPFPRLDELASAPIPEEAEGLDRLPMFFDPDFGRVALSATMEGVALLSLREEGGVRERLATFAPPEHLPQVTDSARALLRAYLDYVIDRDAFLGAAAAAAPAPGTEALRRQCADDLREIAAAVVARAVYRARLRGASGGLLDEVAIAEGVRATDADYLDRPTVGRWL